eukprot:scpid37659/ scgid1530/ 
MCYGCCGGAGVLWRCWGAVAVLGGCCCRCQEELPYFGDIVESCQDGKCPLVQFSPLPYFRNDGLLLKQFRHQQEFNICCKDEESKSAHTLYEKSEDTFKKSRISVFGKMKALKGRQVNALSATLPRANATSPSFLRKSIVDPLPPVVVAPASPGRPESPVVRKRTSQFDCGGTTLAGQSNDVDLGIRRRSRSYHCGLEAVSLLTHPCSSMTDIVAGVSLDEPPALTRRFSRSRRRSRSAEPSMLEFDENSEDNNAMISSRRSVPTFSPIAMEMSLSRERSCSLSNIPAAAGSDPTSPPGVASPGRFTRKVESPLVRSGSATQFTFTDPPKPAAQSPTPTKPSQMNKVTTPNDSSHKPSQHGLHLDQPTSTHDKERGKSPLASYEPAAAVSDEEAVRRVKSPIRSNVVKPKPPLHNDDEFPNKVQTSLRRDESASSVKSYPLHRHESSSSCMTNCSSTSGGSASIGMQSESDCFRPVQSSGNSAHKDQQRRHHHHRPSTDSVPSEVSGFASDGSSAAEVDMPTMQQHKRPAPQAYKISCNMQDLVEKISGLGQHHRRGYTINIIVQNQAV